MARSHRKNHRGAGDWFWDYSDSKFRWLWRRERPDRVRYMVEERAFHSFASDLDLIAKRWTQPVRGTSKTEAEIFSNDGGRDICCAGTVGFIAHQTGVVDFIVHDGGVTAVDTYFPTPARVRAGHVKLVKVYSSEDFKPHQKIPTDDFLPGDYFIYARVRAKADPPRKRVDDWLTDAKGKAEKCGDHVNMYLGDFIEVDPDDGDKPVGNTFQLINGSLGQDAAGVYVVPVDLDGDFGWELYGGRGAATGTLIVHCRFVAIERLFQDGIGPPVHARAARPAMSGGPPPPAPPVDPLGDLRAFWQDIKDARAPYPIGANLAWHQGVHVLRDAPDGDDDVTEVLAIAPGEIVAARSGRPLPEGDTSFVLVRHLLDRDTKEIVEPATLDDPDGKQKPLPDNIVPFFSLTMCLAALDPAWLGARKQGEVGSRFAWLEAVRPIAIPENIIPETTPITLLVPDPDAADGYTAIGRAPRPVGGDIDLGEKRDALEIIKIRGEDHYVLSQGSGTFREAWANRPVPKVAAGKLFFYNRQARKVLFTRVPVGTALLHVEQDPDDPDAQRLDVETVDGVEYARIDAFTRPGILKADPSDPTPVPDPQGSDRHVLAVKEGTKRVTIHVDAAGAGADEKLVDASFDVSLAQVVDAAAERDRLAADPDADRSPRTTLAEAAPPDPAAPPKEAHILLDLVPCAALSPPHTEAAIEKELSGKAARLAREADARLARGASRLVVALVGDGPDAEWHVPAAGLSTLSPGTAPSLYTALSTSDGAFKVDIRKKSDDAGKDADWRLAPDGLAGVALHPLAIVPVPKRKDLPGRALVELVYAVRAADIEPVLKKRVDEANAQNRLRQDVAKALGNGDVVDLRKRLADDDHPSPPALRVDRGPIGLVGRLIEEPGGPAGAYGIHVEVFAGRPLATDKPVDPGALPDGGKVTKVAGSPWMAFKDTAPADLTAEIADKLVAGLKALSPPALDTTKLELRSDATQPWKREEWTAFYAQSDRVLSRVVSVHESEWTQDWAKAASESGSRQSTDIQRAPADLERVYGSLAWMDKVSFVQGDKIPDLKSLVFHHPARLVEYLRTRLDVDVTSVSPSLAKDATVTFSAGAETVALTSPRGDGRFSARIATSDASTAPSIQGTVTVAFAKGGLQPLSFPVVVDRGQTSSLSVVEPWASVSSSHPHAPRLPYAIHAHFADESLSDGGDTLYFLADGGSHLNGIGFDRARVTVTAHYNTDAPTLSTPALSSPQANSFSLELPKTAPAAPASPKVAPTMDPTTLSAQTTSVELDVLNHAVDVGEEAEVAVKVTGGDFKKLNLETTRTIKLRTRVILPPNTPAAPKGTSGVDVAQLQIYLSQILAADRIPCLRADDAAASDSVIDGQYTAKSDGLRQALWRFLYAYAHVDVPLDGGRVVYGRELSDFAGRPDAKALMSNPALLAGATSPTPDLAAYIHRTHATPKSGAEWPIVGKELVRRIVDVFVAGAALPEADFDFRGVTPPLIPAQGAPVTIRPPSQDVHARGLPWPAYRLVGSLRAVAPGAKADEVVTIAIPPKDAPYTFKPSGGTTMTARLGDVASPGGVPIELALTGGTAAPSMTATVTRPDGKTTWQISARQLLPARDFFRAWPAEPGTDVLLVQFALTQAPRKAPATGRGFLPAAAPPPGHGKHGAAPSTPTAPVADGVWADAWARAFRQYASEWGLGAKSDVVVPALLNQVFFGLTPA
jgi:hypothetical protein